ncbi:hypothetical protein ABPG72_011623 [Tetrahymena utriculariae]
MKFDIKSLNKYFSVYLKVGLITLCFVPPAVMIWKEKVMHKMGMSIKTDIERVNSKGKSIYEIPKKYSPTDKSVLFQTKTKNLNSLNSKFKQDYDEEEEDVDIFSEGDNLDEIE